MQESEQETYGQRRALSLALAPVTFEEDTESHSALHDVRHFGKTTNSQFVIAMCFSFLNKRPRSTAARRCDALLLMALVAHKISWEGADAAAMSEKATHCGRARMRLISGAYLSQYDRPARSQPYLAVR